jgi:hypothetical protein
MRSRLDGLFLFYPPRLLSDVISLRGLRGLHESSPRCDMSDPLGHIIVGNPDPTSDLHMYNGYRRCGFEWFDDTGLALVLRWQCTRESGHPGQHLAGTGHRVAAVHRIEKPRKRAHRSPGSDG